MSRAVDWSHLWQLGALAARMPRTDDSLHGYIRCVLGYHIPRKAVTPGHDAPFDLIADSFFGRYPRMMVLASRGSGKTLDVAILNLLKSKFYPRTGTGHYAAIGAQGQWGVSYLREMLAPAYFQKDITKNITSIIRWKNGSWVRVGSGHTTTGVTAFHPNRLIVDEVDLWAPEQYETAQYMISGTRQNPPELLVASTAYTAFGLMTPLMQQAKQRGTKLYKWDSWTSLEPCTECRGEKCPLYAWENPRTAKRELLCRGRALRSDGFIPLDVAIDEYYRTDSETYLVQKLLAAPERRALIYPRFDAGIHASGPPPREAYKAPKGIGVDWGFDHPLVYTVYAELPNGIYWGLEEIGERFATPDREMELALGLRDKYGEDVTFFCGQDQPKSIAAFAEAGLVVVPNSPRRRDEGHKLIRRLMDPNKGPLLFLDPSTMPMTVVQLGAIHRDQKGREVLKDNDFADSSRHVLATAQEMGGVRGGGVFIR